MKRRALFSADGDGVVLLSCLGRRNREYCVVTPHFAEGSRSASLKHNHNVRHCGLRGR